jgi:uncharacterized membrane protein
MVKNMCPKLKTSNRVVIIDELRGFAVLCMIVYHLFYSMIYIYGVDLGPNVQKIMTMVQPFGAGLFIAISGFSSSYSKNNIKRGFQFLIAGLLISLLTGIFMPSQTILFGILHFLGISILLFELIKRFAINADAKVVMIISATIFFTTFNLARGWLFLPVFGRMVLPEWMYQNNLFVPIGLPSSNFISADYFPLLPWFALFIFGSQVGKIAKQNMLHTSFYKSRTSILSRISKYALVIYFVHQPIIIAVLYVFFRTFKL